jgi:hypothetical protein
VEATNEPVDIYDYSITGSSGSLERTVAFRIAILSAAPSWIEGGSVVIPGGARNGKPLIEMFPYPAGGSPTKIIRKFERKAYFGFSGAAVSVAPRSNR